MGGIEPLKTVLFAHAVYLHDVGMVQPRSDLGFPLKTRQVTLFEQRLPWQYFHRSRFRPAGT